MENSGKSRSGHGLFEREPPPLRLKHPLMIAVSAPSGAGKSTLCNRLAAEFEELEYSISCTTRAPRGEELDGKHYYFLSHREFKQRIGNGEFLEHARVHGNFYGTLEDTVLFTMEGGAHIILDIDVQGMRRVRDTLGHFHAHHPIRRGFTSVFISPPSVEALEERLRQRGTDSEKMIRRRLKNAPIEMAAAGEYAHLIVNDNLERAYAELRAIVCGGA